MSVNGPQTIAGRYAIWDRIASGGMASVYFGRLVGAVGFSRTVAIKRLHPHLARKPEFVAAMIDEARLAARIRHPNVVSTLDVVAAEGELLVVMEYVRGESLARLLRGERARGRRIPREIISAIVIGALRGLHAAHEATDDLGAPLGLVHRDVSPHNVLVGTEGVPRVIDFGVAKAAGRLQQTESGVLKGKMAYMAPEQIAAEPVSRTADVYAMGVLLWEALAGRHLFDADSDARLVVMALDGAKEPPSMHAPDVPPELDALVMKALATAAVDRFQTADDMAEELRRVVSPAYETEVGKWVSDVASVEIAERDAALAEIERSSGTMAAPVADAREMAMRDIRASSPPAAPSGGLKVNTSRPFASHLERGSVTPARTDADSPMRRRSTWLIVVLAALVASIIIAVDVHAVNERRARTPETNSDDAIAPSVTAAAPSAPLAPPPVDTADGSAAQRPSSSGEATSAPAAAPSARPPPPHRHHHPRTP